MPNAIEHVRLGGSGLHVSRLALGMMSYGDPSHTAWALDERAAEPVVKRAVEIGIAARASAVVAEPRAVGQDWPWPIG